MDTAAITGDYTRFSETAFLLVRDPIVAEVIAVDAVLAASRKSVAPDAPPALQMAQRRLARQAVGYMRRRRLARLLPWTKDRPDGVDLPESTRRVWDAVAALRPRQQVAVVLARVHGSNLAEIADVLDASTSAASAHLENGRKVLAERFGDDADLRPMLTRELQAVAAAFVREHRPDPVAAEEAMRRSMRWRIWGFALGTLLVAAATTLVLNLR